MTYPAKVVITTHYAADDLKFNSDYCSVTIEINEILVEEYGDASHDKGKEKAQGWEDAIGVLYPHWHIIHKQVADYEI